MLGRVRRTKIGVLVVCSAKSFISLASYSAHDRWQRVGGLRIARYAVQYRRNSASRSPGPALIRTTYIARPRNTHFCDRRLIYEADPMPSSAARVAQHSPEPERFAPCVRQPRMGGLGRCCSWTERGGKAWCLLRRPATLFFATTETTTTTHPLLALCFMCHRLVHWCRLPLG